MTTSLDRLPLTRTDPFAPPADYARLRDAGGITRVLTAEGTEGWLVTGADLVRRVLTDPRFGIVPPGAPALDEPSLFTDGEAHARLRRLLAPTFGPRRVEALRSRVTSIVEGLVGPLLDAGPPVDLVAHLARPLPLAVISEILGVEVGERERFHRWADAAMGLAVGADGDYGQAWGELVGFLDELVAAKRAIPSGDLLSELVAVRDADDGRLSDAELRTSAVALLVAGYLTTANALSIGLVGLLAEHRLGDLRDPGPVVEEMLRLQSGRNGEIMPRFAKEDVELGDVCVAAGEMVLARVEAANHDPESFERPECFVTERSRNPHLGFGHGPHHCLGAALARLELTCVLTVLAARAPDLALADDPGDIPWTGHPLDDGPAVLRVTW